MEHKLIPQGMLVAFHFLLSGIYLSGRTVGALIERPFSVVIAGRLRAIHDRPYEFCRFDGLFRNRNGQHNSILRFPSFGDGRNP